MIWQSMISKHCRSGAHCARRELFAAGKEPVSDDLMPVGVYASRAFLSLL